MIDIEALTGPIAEGLVPAHIYHDDEVHRLEVERLFSRAWVFVAHTLRGAATGRLRGAQRGRRLLPRHPRPRRRHPRHVQHVRAPRDAGVPSRAGHRVDLPLPVPRVDLPQRRHAGGRPVPRRGLRRRRGLREGGPGAAARARARDPQRDGVREPRPGRAAVRGVAGRLRLLPGLLHGPEPGRDGAAGPAALADQGQLEDRRRELRRRQLPHAPHPRQRRGDRAVRRTPAPQAQGGRALPRRPGRRHDLQAAAGRRRGVRAPLRRLPPRRHRLRSGRLAGRRPAGAHRPQRLHALRGDAVPEPELRAQLARGGRRPGGAVHLDPPVAAGGARRDRGAVVVRGRGGRPRVVQGRLLPRLPDVLRIVGHVRAGRRRELGLDHLDGPRRDGPAPAAQQPHGSPARRHAARRRVPGLRRAGLGPPGLRRAQPAPPALAVGRGARAGRRPTCPGLAFGRGRDER